MRRFHSFVRTSLFAAIFLCGSFSVRADTIVLKNGRRIVALAVVEEGDKVRYQTSAGELTIPKSIVDHIEKGGFVATQDAASGASQLAITAPVLKSSLGSESIEHGAVHDGGIDREFIAKLDRDAQSGSRTANDAAALAHHAAAQFELSHGSIERALAEESAALNYAPGQSAILLNVAYLRLRKSEFRESLEFLERARRLAPDDPDVPKLTGWAYYGMNKPDQAVAEWKRSLALRADPEVQAALEKAQRDSQEEAGYRENASAHFTLRYSGSAEPELAREVLHALEGHFAAVESELDYSPPDSIGVILYTQQTFADITRAPGWVGALNDGRIRIPVQGLTGVTPELSRVLKHELTHSFVAQRTRGHVPTWLQEGLAQWMEGKRSDNDAEALLRAYDAKQTRPLSQLEGSWMGLPNDQVASAYAWALASVEYIIRNGGMGDIERILDRLATGASMEAALKEVLHNDYAELFQSTADYLRRAYSR